MSLETLLKKLDTRRDRVLELHSGLTARVAMSPDNGGDGEWEKGAWYEEELKKLGLTNIIHYDAPDDRVSAKKRPNFIIKVEGKSPKTLWIMGHLDVVPAGAKTLWNTDPYEVVLDKDNDTFYGRGVEDNQQALVSAALLAAELIEENIVPEISFGILAVADEETSNTYGIDYLMQNHPNIVKEGDLVLVPDFGTEDGAMVEIGEKGVMWLRVSISGKQCHASTPEEGVNTLVIAAEMIAKTKEIQSFFKEKDDLFKPNYSTITPTRILENVPNTNTISGHDVFHIDCRILPCYSLEEVQEKVAQEFAIIAQKYNANVLVEIQSTEAPAPLTPKDAEVVVKLQEAIKAIYNIDAKVGGIGGSTVASRFRMRNIPAAVWARVHPTYHMPNEKSKISHNINDAKIYAHMLYNAK